MRKLSDTDEHRTVLQRSQEKKWLKDPTPAIILFTSLCASTWTESRGRHAWKLAKWRATGFLKKRADFCRNPSRIESSCSIIALPKSSSSLSLNVIKLPPPKLSQRSFLCYCTDYRGQCSYIEQWEYVQTLKAANWKPLVTIATSPEPYAAWECEYMYYT